MKLFFAIFLATLSFQPGFKSFKLAKTIVLKINNLNLNIWSIWKFLFPKMKTFPYKIFGTNIPLNPMEVVHFVNYRWFLFEFLFLNPNVLASWWSYPFLRWKSTKLWHCLEKLNLNHCNSQFWKIFGMGSKVQS